MLLDLDKLIEKHNIQLSGVLHVGAHLAEEAPNYDKVATHVLWVEGNPNLIKGINKVLKPYKNQEVVNMLVSEVSGTTVDFNISNDTQASSVLLPGEIKYYHSDIINEDVLRLTTKRLDDYFDDEYSTTPDFNFINLDIQGLELNALKGLGRYIDSFKYIYTEVNLIEIYKGVPLLWEMDLFLMKNGFYRSETQLTPMGWGDAIYIRGNVSFLKKAMLLSKAFYWEAFFKIKTFALKLIRR